MEYKKLIGKTVSDLKTDAETFTLYLKDGSSCRFYHDQDCCESVTIKSIDGTLYALIDQEIVDVQEYIGDPEGWTLGTGEDSHTWTKYVFKTRTNEVSISWFGVSNGYYSESVNFQWLEKTVVERPHRAYEIDIKAGGDTMEDLYYIVKQYMDEFFTEKQPINSTSGGSSSNAIVQARIDTSMTHDRYFEQLERYLESTKNPKIPETPGWSLTFEEKQ